MGALLVYDITKRETFTNVARWLRELRLFREESVVVVLVGNKCDLEAQREVPKEEGGSFAGRKENLKVFFQFLKGNFQFFQKKNLNFFWILELFKKIFLNFLKKSFEIF